MTILRKKTYRSTPNAQTPRGHYYRKDPRAIEINLNNIMANPMRLDPQFKEGEQVISKRAIQYADLVKSFAKLKENESFIKGIKQIKDIKVENGTISYTFDGDKWIAEKELSNTYFLAFKMDDVWPFYLEKNKNILDLIKKKEQKKRMEETEMKMENRSKAQKNRKTKKT